MRFQSPPTTRRGFGKKAAHSTQHIHTPSTILNVRSDSLSSVYLPLVTEVIVSTDKYLLLERPTPYRPHSALTDIGPKHTPQRRLSASPASVESGAPPSPVSAAVPRPSAPHSSRSAGTGPPAAAVSVPLPGRPRAQGPSPSLSRKCVRDGRRYTAEKRTEEGEVRGETCGVLWSWWLYCAHWRPSPRGTAPTTAAATATAASTGRWCARASLAGPGTTAPSACVRRGFRGLVLRRLQTACTRRCRSAATW